MLANGGQVTSSGPSRPTEQLLQASDLIDSAQFFSYLVFSEYNIPGVLGGVGGVVGAFGSSEYCGYADGHVSLGITLYDECSMAVAD